MNRKITTTEAEEIRQAHQSGVPSSRLAAYYNITTRRVQQICNRGEKANAKPAAPIVRACS